MAEFIMRMFTPSKSDGSGMVSPQSAPKAPKKPEPERSGIAKAKTASKFGGGLAEDEAKIAKKKLLGA